MNTDLKLDIDFKKMLPALRRALPYIFGVAMIGVFAYTAWVVNAALNVQPDPTAVSAIDPTSKIVFDKQTIAALKNLQAVQGDVPAGDLGKTDPFK